MSEGPTGEQIFTIEDEHGRPLSVDASRWRYVLVEYPDGLHQMVIEAPDLVAASEETRLTAAELVLDHYLGEERRQKLIGEIEVVPALSERETLCARRLADVARDLPG